MKIIKLFMKISIQAIIAWLIRQTVEVTLFMQIVTWKKDLAEVYGWWLLHARYEETLIRLIFTSEEQLD